MPLERGPLTILHLGLGAFHRAHQAAYLEKLIEKGDTRWSLASGNIRPGMADVIEALATQHGEYILETVDAAGARQYDRIRSIRQVIPYTPNIEGVIGLGSAANTRIISFTATEAGYYLTPDDNLDLAHGDVAGDIEVARSGRPGTTIYGALTAICRARMAAHAGKVTLLSCDNLRHNGLRSRRGLLQFAEAIGDTTLRAWIEGETTSPNTMVDRITPRPTAELRDRVLASTGWNDAAPVMSEAFIQWVIEDTFCNGRPDWERVGAEMVADVAPYEEAKICILNASHSCIGWAGTLIGTTTIHEGACHPAIRALVMDYVTDDVFPCLEPSPIDLIRYRDTVVDRFRNAAIVDTNQRITTDSISKLRGFIAPTIQQRLENDANIASAACLPALYLLFLAQWRDCKLPYDYIESAIDAGLAKSISEAADPVAALCAETSIWGPVAGDARLVMAVRDAQVRLSKSLLQRTIII